jgi:multidrug resistance efflux pump
MKFNILAQRAVIFALLLSLTACGLGQTPTPLPTVVLGNADGANSTSVAPNTSAPQASGKDGVAASASVVPAQMAQLAFAASGSISTVNVTVGDNVTAGQILASLVSTDAELAVAQAEADVAIAQANYDLAQTTEPTAIAAGIAAAQLALLDAQTALNTLTQNAPLEAALAQLAVSDAQKALDDAQRDRDKMNYPRADDITIEDAQAHYEAMQEEVDQAQAAYDNLKDRPVDDADRSRALKNLNAAKYERDKALATLNWYRGENSDIDLALADAHLALAQAQLAAAQTHWDEVKVGPSAQKLALAEARITSAQAQLDLANAQITTQALTNAQLAAARARLETAQAQLAKMTITAPFDGAIAALNVHAGEWALVGQPVFQLVDLNHLRVETTDLSERDIPQVSIGQTVTVFFKALNQDATGVVSAIAPLADTLGGDVVYKVTIELDTLPAGLRAGMSAEVQFGSNK